MQAGDAYSSWAPCLTLIFGVRFFSYGGGQKSNAVELPPLLLALKEFAAANDLELKDGSPDGSCMFYAVADQLQVRTLESDHSATLLRQQAVDYLRNNPLHEDGTHLEQFLSTETWSAYLSRMSQPTQWGDHMILRAMSNMLTRNIIVCNVRPDGEVQQHEIVPMKDQRSDKVALYLGHLGEFHYMSLRPKDWEDKWFAKAKEDKRKDTNFGIPSHSILDNDSEETLFQLCSDMTCVDQVSGVPLPHLSYLIVHLLPPVHHMTITLQTQLRLTDSNGSPLLLEQIGSCGHGTRRILKDISYDEKMKKFHDIKWFSPMTFLSIDKSYIVHCSNSGNANKVIIADESQSHPGYCKLRLATNQLPEKYNVVSDKDATYLAKPELDVHPSDRSAMYSVHPSFECNSWPEQASEWISRDRPVRWPPASLVQRIHRQKCFVIQTPHPASLCAQIEWRFNFSRAEKILLNEALSDNQKQCFDTYQIVVEYHLRNLKRRLSSVHLKSVFFYACEQIGESYWMDSFGGCFLYLIASLLRCLKERKLPNYFIRENNMIDHMDNETVEDIQNALDPIRLFPIESMTFMVERHGYNLGWISRSIKADIPLYVRDVHKDLNRVVRKVFVPTTLKRAMKLANEQQYEYAIEAVNTAYEELLMTPPAIDGSPTRMPRDSSHFLSEVIHNIDDESTAYLFGTYLNRLTGRKIYRNVSSISTLRIRDLTDGEDTGGMGDAPVPKKYQHSTLLRATYLDDLAYRFYSLGKYKISGKFLGHAINLIQKDLTSDTLDVDEISNAELRQDIARQTYENKYMMTSYLVTIMQHLTVLCWPEMLMAKLTQIEEVCERFNNPAVVKYLANMWQRLRYFDRAEEIRTKFGVLGYDEGVDQNYEDMLTDPYNQTQYI
ncbi:hypothetical protein FSP39_002540 [Pinctada imbricata]|uniref:OTU domain-containing protein n=1 Tax=Pinctada imbricata TaxID=66713 RepID=A0AA88YPI8_PINIB|nr:hypothetical protein FSP39_002540 [Pinctada imbricata]